MATEPPTTSWIDHLLSAGRNVIAPVVSGDQLDWVGVTDIGSVDASELGFDEPVGVRLGPEAVTQCDVVVVPALAADYRGTRLGRGAGYYDRALALVTAPTVAVVFTDELIPQVPSEPHDLPVRSVLTPGGVFRVHPG